MATPTTDASPTVSATRERVRIGLVSVSDRASTGVYEDKGLPALREWLSRALLNPIDWEARLIPDEQDVIAATLRELVDSAHCDLVLTTGGTGPAPRDVTPEATLAVAHAGADLQRLRALVRNARKDAASAPEQRSGRAYRELFQFVRENERSDDA